MVACCTVPHSMTLPLPNGAFSKFRSITRTVEFTTVLRKDGGITARQEADRADAARLLASGCCAVRVVALASGSADEAFAGGFDAFDSGDQGLTIRGILHSLIVVHFLRSDQFAQGAGKGVHA